MGWLQRQFDLAEQEYAAYPEWKKRAYAVPHPFDFPTPEMGTPTVNADAPPKVIRGDRQDERCELCRHLLSQHIAAVGCTARDCGCVREPK